MISLNYQMDRILDKIFKIILIIFKKKDIDIDKPSLQIFVIKIENSITFTIKNGYNLELLTPETMKLLGSTENKITKDKTVEMCRK